MIVTGHINYFSITECGLYKHGDNKSYGISLEETLKLVADWVKGKPLADTLPWDAAGSRTGVSKCYCRDFYKDENSGEYVFVLWKSDTDAAGTLLGAQEDARTGEGKVVEYTNNFEGKKVIWGRPCYYWFVPSLNMVASLKFEHSVCDSTMMQEWFLRAITNKVRHESKLKETTQTGQIRFSFVEPKENSSLRMSYRFDVGLKSINTASAQLQQLASQITHIVKRETIRLDTPKDERAAWVKLFDGIEYLNTKPKAKIRQIELRAEARPTASELQKIIEAFAKEARKNGDWDNVGFETAQGTTVWVDRYRLHGSLNINQEKFDVFSAAELHKRITERRGDILRQLIADDSVVKTG